MLLRRILVPILVGGLALIAVPAHARWGLARVDTWARAGDRIVGHHAGAGRLEVRVPSGSAERVIWSVENLGGGEPRLHEVTFFGCGSANGFDIRYLTSAGKDVTDAVLHAGYVAHRVENHERAWLVMRVTARASSRTRLCRLTGVGMHADDVVHLRLKS